MKVKENKFPVPKGKVTAETGGTEFAMRAYTEAELSCIEDSLIREHF